MARGRMIANTVATDKRFNSLTIEAALVYLMAIPHLDRDGLILGDTMPFWGKVCPRRTELMGVMADIIDEWVKAGLVIAYETEDGTVLCFTGFNKNQTGIRYDRESPSQFPPPPGYVRTGDGLEKISGEPNPDEVRSKSGLHPDEVPLKVKQSKTNKSNGKAKDDHDHDDWRSVVDTYQREIGTFTATISDEMKEWYDDIGATMLIDAIKEAARNNIRKWSYVDGILKRWKANGRSGPKNSGDAWAQLESNLPDYMKA